MIEAELKEKLLEGLATNARLRDRLCNYLNLMVLERLECTVAQRCSIEDVNFNLGRIAQLKDLVKLFDKSASL